MPKRKSVRTPEEEAAFQLERKRRDAERKRQKRAELKAVCSVEMNESISQISVTISVVDLTGEEENDEVIGRPLTLQSCSPHSAVSGVVQQENESEMMGLGTFVSVLEVLGSNRFLRVSLLNGLELIRSFAVSGVIMSMNSEMGPASMNRVSVILRTADGADVQLVAWKQAARDFDALKAKKHMVLLAQNVCLREVTETKSRFNLGDFAFELHGNPPYATFSLHESRDPPPHRNPDAVYESMSLLEICNCATNSHICINDGYLGTVPVVNNANDRMVGTLFRGKTVLKLIVKEPSSFDGFAIGTPVNVKGKITEETSTLVLHVDSVAQFEKREVAAAGLVDMLAATVSPMKRKLAKEKEAEGSKKAKSSL
ncbi:hypothetical protein M3Y95_00588100 [Aphelenchoides besseyi]|nr:hypothetical protein M3Y95_00588100 [Aphelenchoides besseyi]